MKKKLSGNVVKGKMSEQCQVNLTFAASCKSNPGRCQHEWAGDDRKAIGRESPDPASVMWHLFSTVPPVDPCEYFLWPIVWRFAGDDVALRFKTANGCLVYHRTPEWDNCEGAHRTRAARGKL